jgi:hypothetical protein
MLRAGDAHSGLFKAAADIRKPVDLFAVQGLNNFGVGLFIVIGQATTGCGLLLDVNNVFVSATITMVLMPLTTSIIYRMSILFRCILQVLQIVATC